MNVSEMIMIVVVNPNAILNIFYDTVFETKIASIKNYLTALI